MSRTNNKQSELQTSLSAIVTQTYKLMQTENELFYKEKFNEHVVVITLVCCRLISFLKLFGAPGFKRLR